MSTLLEALLARGWIVHVTGKNGSAVPGIVAARYPRLPPEVLRFVSALEACRSPDQSVWFPTREDFTRDAESGFRWNECELMAKEAAEGDLDALREVEAFWDQHFPFMLAVHSDYDYLAVRVGDGVVVHGSAPEWESPLVVAGSFATFLLDFQAAAESVEPPWPYSLFLGGS